MKRILLTLILFAASAASAGTFTLYEGLEYATPAGETLLLDLRVHAARFNLDPSRIGVFGASAGGHIASVLGTSGGVSAGAKRRAVR